MVAKKILLIEDDPSLQTIYQTLFKNQGWDIDPAYDGKVGLTKALHNKPDIILLDLMLPVMNGLDVLKVLKETDTTKEIPIIVVTNLSGGMEIEECRSLGVVDCILKAENTPDQILERVKRVLRDRS